MLGYLSGAERVLLNRINETDNKARAYALLGEVRRVEAMAHGERAHGLQQQLAVVRRTGSGGGAVQRQILTLQQAVRGSFKRAGLSRQQALWAYRRALQYRPGAVAAQLACGRTALELKEPAFELAEEMFTEVLKRDPQNVEACRGLARVYYATDRLDDALRTVSAVSASHPDNDDLAILQASILLELGEFEQAELIADHILELKPRQYGAAFVRGEAMLEQGRYPEAIEDLRVALVGDLHWARARYALARALEKSGDTVEAKKTYRQVIDDAKRTELEVTPGQDVAPGQRHEYGLKAVLALYQLQEKGREAVTAELRAEYFTLAKSFAISFSEGLSLQFGLGRLTESKFSSGLQECVAGLRTLAAEDEASLRLPLLEAHFQALAYGLQGDTDRAIAPYREVARTVSANPSSAAVSLLIIQFVATVGDVYMHDPDQALDLCLAGKEIFAGDARFTAYLVELCIKQGAYVEALRASEEALQVEPDNVVLLLQLANVQAQVEQYDKAKVSYAAVVDSAGRVLPGLTPDSIQRQVAVGCRRRALLALAAIARIQGDDQLAQEHLLQLLEETSPNALVGQVLRGYARENDWSAAVSLLRSLPPERLDTPGLRWALGMALMRQAFAQPGPVSVVAQGAAVRDAQVEFSRSLELQPTLDAAVALVMTHVLQGQPREALAVCRKLEEPLKSEIRPFQALALQLAGDLDGAVRLLTPAAGAALDQVGTVFLASMKAARGELTTSSADDVAEKAPPTRAYETARRMHLEFLQNLGSADAVAAARHTNLLLAYVFLHWLRPAQAEAEALAQLLPGDLLPELALVRLLEDDGAHAEAVAKCRSLIDQHPDFLPTYHILAGYHLRRGERSEGLQVLQELAGLTSGNVQAQVLTAMAQVHESEGRFAEAARLYKEGIAVAEDNLVLVSAYNNLAYLQATRTGQLEEALQHAMKAADLAPRNYAVADTLGWIWFLKGDPQEAVKHLQVARAHAPNNPTIRYHLGAAYRELGELEKARREFEQALVISSDFAEREQAREALSEISALPRKG